MDKTAEPILPNLMSRPSIKFNLKIFGNSKVITWKSSATLLVDPVLKIDSTFYRSLDLCQLNKILMLISRLIETYV